MNIDDLEFKIVVVPSKPFVKIKKPKNKQYHASFIINEMALKILLENKATAMQICSFLTLSCFTKQNHGKYNSTGSYNAIINRLGIGISKAKQMVYELCQMEYNGNKLLKLTSSAYKLKETEKLDNDGKVIGWSYEIDYNTGLNEFYIANKGRFALVRWELPRESHKELC
jgi:hypothetical protein